MKEDYILEVSYNDICKCNDNDNLTEIRNKIQENEEIFDDTIEHYHMYDQVQNTCDICKKIYFLLKDMELYENDNNKGGKKKQKKRNK